MSQLVLSLFDNPERPQKIAILPAPAQRVVKPVWGLKKADLQVLPYNVLAQIFRGVHNLIVPNAMAEVLNPDELLAKYRGAALLKKNDAHLRNIYDFLGLVRALDTIAYDGRFSPLVERARGRNFPAESGAQRARLKTLRDETNEAFLASFEEKYNWSNNECPDNFSYYDPNCDGADKRIYVDRIFGKLKERQANPKL